MIYLGQDPIGISNIPESYPELVQDVSELKSDLDSKAPAILRDASGDIATFSDGADGMPLKECVVQIDPVQSGSGDPSPTNVRPITGWTGANVYRTETPVNLGSWEQGAITGSNSTTNVGKTYSELKVSSTSRIRLSSLVSVDAAKTYAVFADSSKYDVVIQPYNSKGKSIRTYSGETWGAWVDTPVFLTGVPNYAIAIRKKSGADIVPDEISDVHLVVAERTTYHISWQTAAGTVYGGNVNPLTGVLTVDRAIVDMGTRTWSKNGDRFADGAKIVPNPVSQGTWGVSNPIAICSSYKYGNIGNGSGVDDAFGFYNGYLYARDTAYETAADFKAAVNGVMVVYKLATPVTYQLDPVQITALRESSIWADTGAISVTYPADTQTYVDTLVQTATDPDSNIVTVSGSTPSITGESGKRYICGTVDSISITPPQTGIIDVVFTSGTTPAVLTVPNTVRFPAWFNPASLDASMKYEINIMDGTDGAVMAWPI